MKIIFKKPLWFTVITTLCLVVVTLFAAIGCDKSEISPKTCNVENPLTDLSWLKEIIDGFEYDAVTLGYNPHAKIYQCNYKNGTGFLLEMCVECPDAGYTFRDCEGIVLCSGGGFSGEDNCSELNIDFENKKLIWEKKENTMNNSCEFENPLTDLPWLKKMIAENAVMGKEIYQCTYKDGIGFLIAGSSMQFFYNCVGEVICVLGGAVGETCPELNIDFENMKLIWISN